MKSVLALVDCRAFYVSCERVFNVAIRQKPVIVLGNNDGIIVALSQEAKALGLRRGQAAFQCREIIETHAVASFSSNYQLYADLSARVMATLATFTSAMEVYSIVTGRMQRDGQGSTQRRSGGSRRTLRTL